VNGAVYNFTDVHCERGMFVGECTTQPHYGKLAWLDDNGFQFFWEHRIEATEVNKQLTDGTYHMWGGELRDKLPHGARYYMNGGRR
jgi:hypothetical protein